jgi:flagellin
MPFSILNNVAGTNAQNQLNLNSINLNRTLLRLSSGKRINSGADDAAGLGIADSLKASLRALDQAVRNANDGISVCQIADGALQEIGNLLNRGVQLAEEAATGTVDDANGRKALNDELDSIKDEIERIATKTTYNGVELFTNNAGALSGGLSIFVGDVTAQSSISVTFAVIATNDVGGGDLAGVNISTADNAAATLNELKVAITGIASARANLGAGMNRLQSAVAVIMNQYQNTQAAESNIRDANIAEEIANMTKFQILNQSGIAALTQANSSAQSVLSLLRQ